MDNELYKYNLDIESLTKDNRNLYKVNKSMEIKVQGLEISNASLKDTLDNLDKIKKIELDSIKETYENKIIKLEDRLSEFNSIKDKEFGNLENRLRIEFEADKKLSIAEIKLELVDVKNKYGELLKEYNELASKNK